MKRVLSIIMAVMLLTTFTGIGNIVSAEESKASAVPSEELASLEEVSKEIKSLNAEENGEIQMSLFAATNTISGTVSLPSGVTAKNGDKVRIYVYKADEISDGFVTKEYSDSETTKNFSFTAGDTSVSYSVSVPDGSYNIAARLYTGRKEVSGEMVFYRSTGAATPNSLLADKITASGGASKSNINITLAAAASYIKGTLDLTETVPTEGTYLNLSSLNQSNGFYSYSYAYVWVDAGQTSVSYELGVNGENCYFRVGSDYFPARYYSSNGLTSVYSERAILDVTSPVSDLDIAVLPQSNMEYDGITVTINFAQTHNETKQYYVAITGAENEYGYAISYGELWINCYAGDSSVTGTIFMDEVPTEPIYLTYRDITGNDSIYTELDESTIYYSEELGIVGKRSMATDITGLTEIEVVEPEFLSISGDIDTQGNNLPANKYLYIGAEFDNGETFCSRTLVSDGEYKINVPARLRGSDFDLFIAQDSFATADSDTIEYIISKTLTGNLEDITVTAGDYRAISGTISLYEAAPADGVTVKLGYNDDGNETIIGTFIIAPGESSVDYNLSIPDGLSANAYLFAETEIYKRANVAKYTAVPLTNADEYNLYLGESVTIGGKLKLPDGEVADKDITIQIQASGDLGMWLYSYVSIRKGENSTNYTINVPKGISLRTLSVRLESKNTNYITQIYYTTAGWKDSYTYLNSSFTQDTDYDITLMKAAAISGVIKLPENAVHTGGMVQYTVYAENTSTGTRYESEYYRVSALYDNIPFSVPVPSGQGGSYRISLYVNYAADSNLMANTWYYYQSEGVMTTAQNSAASVENNSVITLTFPVAKSVSGTISFESGSVVKASEDEEGLEMYIRLTSTTGGGNYSKSIKDVKGTGAIPFTIPVGDGETYNMSVYIYNNNDVFTNVKISKYLYLGSSGVSENQSDAIAVEGDGDTVNFVVPRYKTLSGKVNVTSDYQVINRPKTGNVYLKKSGETSSKNYKTYFDENLNYIAMLEDEVSGEYTATISFGDMATNIIKKSYAYGNEETGSTLTFNGSDVTGKDFTAEIGYAVSGVVALPENAHIPGYTYGSWLYLQADNGSYSSSVKGISEENREVPFMFGVPKTGLNNAYFQMSVSSTSGSGSSNLYKDNTYYVSNTSSTSTYANRGAMNITGDVSGIRFLYMTGVVYTYNLSRPEGVPGTLNGYVYLLDKNGSTLKSNSFYMFESDTVPRKVEFVLSGEMVGEKILPYYIVKTDDTNSDGIYRGKVYVNSDGSLTAMKSEAQQDTVSGDRTFDIELIKSEDIDFPNYVFESEHPYSKGTKSYSYEYSDTTVDGLKVTFSEDTCMASGDYMTISGSSTKYYENDLAGKTIVVSGSNITITITANSYYDCEFGFGITNIEGIKYVLTSEHPYVCDYQEHTYEYSYPEDVESIDVTFAKESALRSSDYLYVYDSNGNQIKRYTYTSTFDEIITVPGNYIKVVLDSNSSTSSNDKFGFAITEVKPTPTFTVKYVNYNGDVIKEESVLRGGDVYSPDDPSRPTENGMAYDFVGWDKQSYNVQSDMVINAIYESEICVMESEHPRPAYSTLEFGPYEFDGEADGIFVTFSPKTALYGSATSSSRDVLTIYTYTNGDGTGEIYNSYYGKELAGQTIALPGKKFSISYTTRSSAGKPFGFRITSVTEAVYHTVKFLDRNGNVLETKDVPAKTAATFTGTLPPSSACGNKMYVFKGWDKDISCVTDDMTVTALYDEVEGYFESEHPYSTNVNETYSYVHDNPEATQLNVTFSYDTYFGYYDYLYIYDANGILVGEYTGSLLAGTTVNVPGNAFTLNFVSDSYYSNGYGFKIEGVVGKVPQYYTVSYTDYTGKVIYNDTVLEGSASWYTGTIPQKPMENGVYYYFQGWNQDTSYVTSNMTVYPVYNEVKYTPIYTEKDLRNIANDLDGRYVLMNDITLTSAWTPVGTQEAPFTGILRGNKHIIKNVTLNLTPSTDTPVLAGFFGYTAPMAEIMELGLEIDYDISAAGCSVNAGGLVAMAHETMIDSCFVSGEITVVSSAKAYVGGMVSIMTLGNIMHCYTDVNITANAGDTVAGMVYSVSGGHIMEGYSNSYINGSDVSKAGFAYCVETYIMDDAAASVMNPNFHYCIYNSDRTSIGLTDDEMLYGTIWAKTSAELKTLSTYSVWDENVGGYMPIWNFDMIWDLDDSINDGFPNLRFVNTAPYFKDITASKKTEDGEIVTTVEYTLSKEIEEDADVVFAAFKDNRLIGIVPLPIASGTICGEKNLPLDADYVKIFVWKDMAGMRPVAKPGEAPVK